MHICMIMVLMAHELNHSLSMHVQLFSGAQGLHFGMSLHLHNDNVRATSKSSMGLHKCVGSSKPWLLICNKYQTPASPNQLK